MPITRTRGIARTSPKHHAPRSSGMQTFREWLQRRARMQLKPSAPKAAPHPMFDYRPYNSSSLRAVKEAYEWV